MPSHLAGVLSSGEAEERGLRRNGPRGDRRRDCRVAAAPSAPCDRLPTRAIALIQLLVGGTVWARTDGQVAALVEQRRIDPAGFRAAEVARMTQVMAPCCPRRELKWRHPSVANDAPKYSGVPRARTISGGRALDGA